MKLIWYVRIVKYRNGIVKQMFWQRMEIVIVPYLMCERKVQTFVVVLTSTSNSGIKKTQKSLH
jgi:hypothetical protein